ncbi:DUF2568 domain-containing protein [Demequina soli]|uniref:DUF2568 domain-containing protein n=1 Tax=Demequina soli TaxID=1638987 RepID=UPI0007815548|nr:DUF2568 domain-containing protein [Demequina soli]
MRWLGATLVFLAELSLLASMVWWPLAALDGPASWALAVVLPVAVATLWGVYLSPRASRPIAPAPTVVARTLLLLAALPLYADLGAWALVAAHALAVVVGTALSLWRPLPA